MSRVLVFGDTYLQKHLDCAESLLPDLAVHDLNYILTRDRALPRGLKCDALVYFNRPAVPPPAEYDPVPRILIDHGASNLKWFLANGARFDFFDTIITAGHGHVASLLAFFADGSPYDDKVRPGAFIKAKELLSPPKLARDQLAREFGLDPHRPIVLFAPTWHLSAQPDIVKAGKAVASIENHIATLHPESAHFNVPGLNVAENVHGITTELLKHADCVVSDTSSTIFEAAARNTPVVQVGLREYSDNNALLYDFPYVAGTSELFLGGAYARPEQVESTVRRILNREAGLLECQEKLFERILAGTTITPDSSQIVIDEIVSSLECRPRRTVRPSSRVVSRRQENLVEVHESLRFAKNRLIAHGGGDLDSLHASNSEEAVESALSAIDVVELDFVDGADGPLVAHDTFETRYGIQGPFASISVGDFLKSRYEGVLTPLSLARAIELTSGRASKGLVCDVKVPRGRYSSVVQQIFDAARDQDAVSRTVMQCYSVEDFRTALTVGFERVLLPVWKYFYRDPTGEDAFDFIASCVGMSAESVVGISMPWFNKHMSGPIVGLSSFPRFLSFWKRVYIHGAPVHEYPSLLRRNLGLFADRISPSVEFQHVPRAFDWTQYLFLNPGLIDAEVDNQVSAIDHYIRWGRGEDRLTSFDAPAGFAYPTYLDLNPGLRQGGVGGQNSALAHWTRFGRHEGRRYSR